MKGGKSVRWGKRNRRRKIKKKENGERKGRIDGGIRKGRMNMNDKVNEK